MAWLIVGVLCSMLVIGTYVIGKRWSEYEDVVFAVGTFIQETSLQEMKLITEDQTLETTALLRKWEELREEAQEYLDFLEDEQSKIFYRIFYTRGLLLTPDSIGMYMFSIHLRIMTWMAYRAKGYDKQPHIDRVAMATEDDTIQVS